MTPMKKIPFMFLLTFSLSFTAFYAQDNDTATDSDEPESTSTQDEMVSEDKGDAEANRREAMWLADSKTIFDIIEPLRQYKEDSDDSSVQKKKRKKQLTAAIQSLNEKMVGRSLSLLAARVNDVTPEREITKFGIKKLKSLRKEIEKDPASKAYIKALGDDWASNPLFAFTLGFYLAGCEKCFRDTGRYIAKYSVVRDTENEYSIQDGIKIMRPDTADGSSEEQYGSEKMITVEIDVLISSENQALKIKKGAVTPLKGTIQNISYEGSQYSEKVTIYLN